MVTSGYFRRLGATVIVAAAVFLADKSANARTGHEVRLDDLLQLKSVDSGQFELSPNGDTLAYVLDDAQKKDLWLFKIKEKEFRGIGEGTMPTWSPDGAQLAFYSMRGGTLQLWVYDVKSKENKQITSVEHGINPSALARFAGWGYDPFRFSWSPDGAQIVFTSQVSVGGKPQPANSGKAEGMRSSDGTNQRLQLGVPLVLTNASPSSWGLSGVFRADYRGPRYVKGKVVTAGDLESSGKPSPVMTDQLFVVNVETNMTIQLTHNNDEHFNPQWSPDGREILFVSTEGSALSGYGTKVSNIYAFVLETNRTIAITTGPGEKRLPYWSPNGEWIAYLGGEHLGRRAVFVLRANKHDPVDVTAQLDRDVGMFHWASDSKSILLRCTDEVSDAIVRVRVPTGEVERLTSTEAYRTPLTVSRSGRLAWVQSDGVSDGVFYVTDSEGHNAEAVLNLNPQISEWSLGKQDVVRWKNSRGEEIEGVLIKPLNYEEGRRYPLIVDPYGSRGSINNFKSNPMLGNQVLASKGYAVFFPNDRAPHMVPNLTKNVAYSRVAAGPKGIDILVDDVMSGVDALVKRGIVDPTRMCLYGFSNGGGSTNLLVTRTTAFKCAVSAAGAATDWPLAFFLGDSGSTMPDLLGGATPWDDPKAYTELSPIYHLDKITTPMLLAVGDDDIGFLLSTIEMYYGLRYLGRDVTLLRYPNQGHGFTGAALEDYWQRVTDFFDFHLQPGKEIEQAISH